MMLDMRQGKRANLETALDEFGLPYGRRIQPASRCRDSLGTPRRRLPSLRALPINQTSAGKCVADPDDGDNRRTTRRFRLEGEGDRG